MNNIAFSLLIVSLFSSCKFDEDSPASVKFKLTVVDESVEFSDINFNAYKEEQGVKTLVANNGMNKIESFEGLNNFDNKFPFVLGYFGIDGRTIESIQNGFFEVELHLKNGKNIIRKFGEIRGTESRKKYEVFLSNDSTIVVK